MVVIRLARTGSKKNPFYHIVVADKRTSRDGRFIERIGYFDPMARGKAARLQLDKERITYWQSNGAQPSPRVSHLLKESEELAEKEPTAKLTRAQARKEQSENSAKAAAKAKKAAEEKMKAEAEAAAKEAASEASAEEEAPEAKTEAEAQPEAKEKSSEEKAE